MHLIKCEGYEGPDPIKFHPTTADKMIIQQLVFNCVKDIPENERQASGNFLVDAVKILYWKYYPEYDKYNRKQILE
jgi:hypothetical protein